MNHSRTPSGQDAEGFTDPLRLMVTKTCMQKLKAEQSVRQKKSPRTSLADVVRARLPR